MTQTGFDSHALGIASVDMQSTYVGGPVSDHGAPLMMHSKFIGDTSQKIVGLVDIYCSPGALRPSLAEKVDSRNTIEQMSDWK